MKIYTYDNKVMTLGGKWMEQPTPVFPPKTIRFDFKYDHWNPTEELPEVSGMSWTHVSDDVYDFHCDSTNWTYQEQGRASLFNNYSYFNPQTGRTAYYMSEHQFDVLDMDLTGVTSVAYLFQGAHQIQNIFSIRNTSSLTNTSYMFTHNLKIPITSVPLFDTSSVTNMSDMFRNCNKLTSIPLFDTSSCTNMNNFANGCTKVESGALALYQQASSQATPPVNHSNTFYNCGRDTTTGAAELAQIPTDWGGTMTDPTIEFND